MPARPIHSAMAIACLASSLWTSAARAQDAQQPDFTTGLWTRSNLLGDAGGVRSGLWNLGITFGLQDVNEVWGNVTGGIQRGASYDGVTLLSIGLDTQRAFGWEGGTFNISAWNIRGRNIATDNLLNLQTPSGILAADTTRLWEVWYQQSFLDGRADVKLGPAERRSGVHDQPGIQPVPQHGDGLADASIGRPLRRRPSLSAVVARRASAHAARLRHHDAARCVRRQSARRPVQRRRTVARQHPLGRQLQPAHRGARDRRDPVRAEPAWQRRRGPWRHRLRAAWHLQAGLLVQLSAVPRSAVRQHGTVAGRSRQHRHRADAVEQLQHLWGG